MEYNFDGLTTDELAAMFIDVVRGGFREDKEFISALKEEIARRKDDVMRLEEVYVS